MLLALSLLAQVAASHPTELTRRVDDYLAPYVRADDFSGVVLIARRDTVLVHRAYGMANWELGAANTTATTFRVASLTKTFTAAGISMLAERGGLRYEDRLSRFLPDFPNGDKITIRHLLLHASGVPDPDYAAIRATPVTLTELIARFRDKPLLFEPGTQSRYSNAGYVLLAAVIEHAGGKPWGTFLRENIFVPFGLTNTFVDREEPVIPGRAAGYVPGPPPLGVENVLYYDMSAFVGSGALRSTAADLHRWGLAVLDDRPFKRSGLEYPYGWGKRTYHGRPLIEQSGTVEGFTSALAVYLDGTIVVCLTNVQANLNERCGQDLAALAFGVPPQPAAAPAAVAPNAAWFDAAVGTYEGPNGWKFDVVAQDGYVYVRWFGDRGTNYVTPIGTDRGFVRVDRSILSVVRDAAGRVTGITRNWGVEPVAFVRVPAK